MAVILELTSATLAEGGAAGLTAWRGLVCATLQISKHDTVPEWLRGWTRSPLGSARRGSSPLGVVSHGAWT